MLKKSAAHKINLEKRLPEDVEKWLARRGASEVEIEIYKIMRAVYARYQRGVRNSDVSETREVFRTGTLEHFNAMIKKKIIKKETKFLYVPLGPEFI